MGPSGLPRGPNFQIVQAVCFPVLTAPWKHIPTSYWGCPWGIRLQECVWESWLPYCGHPDEVAFTGNGPAPKSCEPPPCFRNPKVWSKAITVRSKNTAIGWIFNQLLGHTFSGPTEGKFQILPPRSGIWLHTQYATPPESKSFTFRPGLPGSLQQRKCDGCWFAIFCECQGLP